MFGFVHTNETKPCAGFGFLRINEAKPCAGFGFVETKKKRSLMLALVFCE